MKTENLYTDVLVMLSRVKDDKSKLNEVMTLLEDQMLRGVRTSNSRMGETDGKSLSVQISDVLNKYMAYFKS